MFRKILSLILLVNSYSALASWSSAQRILDGKNRNKAESLVKELVASGYYFSALPLMKDILIKDGKTLSRDMDNTLTKLIENVGVKHFETLPIRFLSRSSSSSIFYVLAKKQFRQKKYNSALRYLARIQNGHKIYPYGKNMEASIHAFKGRNAEALKAFGECISASKSSSDIRSKLNRDHCIAGKARVNFAMGQYVASDLLYLDVSKSSRIWPEILFEEAWNSFYLQNYNRTLGKLVSYKAPVFDNFFNPEVDVLAALSYLKLCLYPDAKKISDKFYDENWRSFKSLHRILKRYKRKNSYFYNLMLDFEQSGKAPNSLVRKIFKSIKSEKSYIDLRDQLGQISKEFNNIRNQDRSRLKSLLLENLQESLQVHKLIFGAYIKGKLKSYYQQLYKSFEGISYIKLEILAQRKAKLYDFSEGGRSRGDIQYIQRNEKQYFWDFNGEFWADELGDYVFALKSEC